jgi:hypothetical protein
VDTIFQVADVASNAALSQYMSTHETAKRTMRTNAY